jgi:phage protein D
MPAESDSSGKGTAQPTVILNGQEVPSAAIASIVIEQDVDQADMCTTTLKNTNDNRYTETLQFGDKIEIKFAETGSADKKTVFKGEIAGLEPNFESGGETQCVTRAFSPMHRLSRGKKSKTYEKQSDADIANAIISAYGMSCEVSGDVNIKYDHVYQHHMTDLEFLLIRARRIDYELVAVPDNDKKMMFRKRDISKGEALTLDMGAKDDSAGAPLRKLSLRLSSANQITGVKVRCWDPNAAKEIIGEASSLKAKLNPKTGGEASKSAFSGGTHQATHDVPVTSTEEAKAVAQAILEDAALNYVTGEAIVKGNPALRAGIIVKVTGADKRFDGKYFVAGCTHKYSHKASGSGGFITVLRVKSNGTST